MKRTLHRPPRAAEALLRFALSDTDAAPVLGDLEETYRYLAQTYSPRQARRWYWGQVARSLPLFFFHTLTWYAIMFKSYFRIAVRSLMRHAQYTVINIVGLAVALAVCIVAYLNHDYAHSFDGFHEDIEAVYRVTSLKEVGGQMQEWGVVPRPLGLMLEDELAGVRASVRYMEMDGAFRVGPQVFSEVVSFADPGFFDLFTFPLQAGVASAYADPSLITLTASMAQKYFGTDDPLGQEVQIRFDGGEMRVYQVGAVVADPPLNSSLRFDAMLPYRALDQLHPPHATNWGRWSGALFVAVPEPGVAASLPAQLTDRYLGVQQSARPDFMLSGFTLTPFSEMYLTAEDLRGNYLQEPVPVSAVVSPSIMALLILLMACFNFMNTAIAFAGRRLKEIGVRKVMGGRRAQLVGQFMGENLLQCVLAFGGALLLAEVFVPAYDGLWPFLDLELSYADNLPLLGFLAVLLLATGVLAAAYPAFYISRFSPIVILRGRQRFGGSNAFTRLLLAFQFTISVMVLIGAFVFRSNATYQENFDMGYAQASLVVVPLTEPGQFGPLRDALAQQPGVAAVAAGRNHLGRSSFAEVLRTEATPGQPVQESEVELYQVGPDYLEAIALPVVQGIGFSADRVGEVDAVLINPQMATLFGWDDPVGQRLMRDDSTWVEVAGMVQTYYAELWNPVEPAVFQLADPDTYNYLVARATNDPTAVAALAEAAWKQVAPDLPYTGFYQAERVLAEAKLVNSSITVVFAYLAFIAVILAATGLFALVSLTIARRTKEIGIRKVMGASAASIGLLIQREFIVLVIGAFLVASGLSYFLMDLLLGSIWTYHIGVSLGPFAAAIALFSGIALLTVGGQVYRAARANPVETLRYE